MGGYTSETYDRLWEEIARGLWKGVTYERTPAAECTASLLDSERRHVALLWSRSRADPIQLARTVDIRPGESFDLIVFARLNDEPLKYFPYTPQNEASMFPQLYLTTR
jgi:hypothetical protein